MKNVVKRLKLILVIGMITVPVFLMAQPGGPGDGGNDTQDAPFDGGVSLLVAAGIAYGLKRKHSKVKEAKISGLIEK